MRIKQWLPITLVLVSSQFTLAQQQVVNFPASAVQADLKYMYSTLQDAHYNLYAYVSKEKYDKVYKSILKSIDKDSLSLLETTKLFQKLAATGNVGHSEVDFPAQPYIAFAQNGGKVFPLELAFEDGTAYIRKNYTSNAAIRVGDQVLSINGKPIKKIQQSIYPYLSAERPYFKNAKLEFWSFPRLYWSTFGEKQSFDVKVKGADGKAEIYRVNAISVMEYETARGGEILTTAPEYKYFGAVAYLNPGPFSSAEPSGEERFKSYIDSVFTDINKKNVQSLIVDLRNNSGGHNAYSDHLISYFANKPFRWYSAFRLKTSEALKEYTRSRTPEAEMDDYTRAILSHRNGETFAYELPTQDPATEAKRFKGKVFVLVNRQTYSMAAVSAALIQDYGFAEIVGEETGDVPTLYASQFSLPLPKTGIIIKIPKGYMVRPNGNEQVAGVKPDHIVRDHLLDAEDEILNYTLNTLIIPTATKK